MKFFKKNIYLILLILLNIVVHFRWISFSIFTKGDWLYYSSESLISLATGSAWSARNTLGSFNVILWRFPFDYFFRIFGEFGFESNIAEKFLVFIPIIILTPVASYFLLSQFIENKMARSISVLLVLYNTYFLTITSQGHLLLNLSFIFGFFSFGFFIKLLKEKSYFYTFISAFFLVICGYIDFRSLYLFLIIFLIFFIFHIATIRINRLKFLFSYLYNALIFFLVIIFTNLYWILPTLFASKGSNDVLDRGLFGSQYWNFLSAFHLHHPFWNNAKPEWFVVQNISIYLYILPLVLVLSFIFLRKNAAKFLYIFTFFLLAGILLSKQIDEPFPDLYLWLFKNIPGFSAFREATKFYLFIVIGYSGIVGLFVQYLLGNKKRVMYEYASKLFIFGIAVLLFIPSLNIVSGRIESVYTPKVMPLEYTLINEYLENDKDSGYRVLSVPRSSKWISFESDKQKLNYSSLLSNNFKNISPWREEESVNFKDNEKFNSVLKRHDFSNITNSLNAKYIVVPNKDADNDNNFYVYYNSDPSDYTSILDRNKNFRKIFNENNLTMYENLSFKDEISFVNNNYFSNVNSKEVTDYLLNRYGYQDFDFAVGELENQEYFSSIYDISDFSSLKSLEDYKIFYNGKKSRIFYEYDESSQKLVLFIEITGLNTEPVSKVIYEGQADQILLDDKIFNLPNESQYLGKIEEYGDISIMLSGDMMEKLSLEEYYKHRDIEETDIEEVQINYLDLTSDGNYILNPSFEEGLWQKKVGDCNNFDDNPIIEMELSDDSSDGNKSLLLSSTRHTACTKQRIGINHFHEYDLSFDFRSDNAASFSLLLSYNDIDNTQERVFVNIDNQNWHTFERSFKVPYGASDLELQLESIPKDQFTKVDTLFDNFSLVESKPYDNIFYLEQSAKRITDLEESYNKISDTEYEIDLDNVTDPQHVILSQTFNPDWKLRGRYDKEKVYNNFHYSTVLRKNGWVVDPEVICGEAPGACVRNEDGSYDLELTIEFGPQKWFERGLIVSGVTFASIIIYLAWTWAKDYKSKRV